MDNGDERMRDATVKLTKEPMQDGQTEIGVEVEDVVVVKFKASQKVKGKLVELIYGNVNEMWVNGQVEIKP